MIFVILIGLQLQEAKLSVPSSSGAYREDGVLGELSPAKLAAMIRNVTLALTLSPNIFKTKGFPAYNLEDLYSLYEKS